MYEIVILERADDKMSMTVVPCSDLSIVEEVAGYIKDETACVRARLIQSFSVEYFFTPDRDVTYGYAPPPFTFLQRRK